MSRTRLTAEEKAARQLQREQERQQRAIARRVARTEARLAAQRERLEKRRLEFEVNLTENARQALALLEPTGMRKDDRGNEVPFWQDAFLGSLAEQFRSGGYLSAGQLGALVDRFNREKMASEAAARWPEVRPGDHVQLLAKVKSIELVNDAYGTTYKIKITARYGRQFSLKTNNQKILGSARRLLENQDLVVVEGQVKWVSDNGLYAALSARGVKLGGLLE